MTTDLEHLLRDSLERDASEAPRIQRAPEGLRRRVRRRQAGTAAATVASLAAVVALTFAVVQLADGDDRYVPTPSEQGSARPVYERTATIEGFTVTGPSDWYLVDYWPVMGRAQEIKDSVKRGETVPGSEWIPGAAGVPVLQLTSYDPGLGAPICGSPTGDDPFPSDGVGLYIALDTASKVDPEEFIPWPNTLTVDPPACDGGTELRFGVRRGGQVVPYLLWYGAGPDASDADRAQLDAIVEAVVVDADQPEIRIPGTDTPGFVLWGGTNEDGSTWTIEARPTDVNIDLKLVTRETDGTYSGSGVADFGVPPNDVEGGFLGVVIEEAVRVEFVPSDGSTPAVAELVDLPPSLGYEADAYWFGEGYPTKDEPADGDLVAIVPEPEPTSTPSVASPVGVAVIPQVGGEGISSDRRYRVEFFAYEGPEGPVVMAEVYAEPRERYGTWQRIQTSAFDPDAMIDHATFSFPWDGTTMPYLAYGIASTDVDEIRGDFEGGGFRIPDYVLRGTRVSLAGTDGSEVFAWVTIGNDPSPGAITALAADGAELASQPFEPAPEGASLSSAEGTTVFLDDTGAFIWRANMTWSNQGILGDVTIQASEGFDHPERWPGHSQTLSLADGFSAAAVTMPGRELDSCLRTIVVGVFDPAEVATVTVDGETLAMTTDDLGSVHLDHAGNTVFWSELCDVNATTSRIAALDPQSNVLVEGPLLPAQLPPISPAVPQ